MPLLYYWRSDNYRRDRRFGFGFHLNQNSPAMRRVGKGDSLWAFTRRERDGLYVLAAEVVVKAVTGNPPNYRYGAWRAWGDLERSRYFDVDVGPRVEPVIRMLSLQAEGRVLGRSFQGHAAAREISSEDHRVLAQFAAELPTIQAAAIYPEDEFEAKLVHDTEVDSYLVRESRPDQGQRMKYLYDTIDIQRARRHVQELQQLYRGRCQICRYDPEGRYECRTCHGHHIQWLSRGGADELENMVLICPNHHSAIHRDDAVFDYNGLAFRFSNGLEEVVSLNEHLPAA